jgi:hypothetical protein
MCVETVTNRGDCRCADVHFEDAAQIDSQGLNGASPSIASGEL